MTTSTDIETRERTPAQQLVAQVRTDQFKEQVAMALPGRNGAERFVRATVTALMQNPDLAGAESDSFFAAVIRCAQAGLLPDGREAAIVTYTTNGVKKAQLLPMVGGIRKNAGEFGWSIRAHVVFERDEFEYEQGLEPKLIHRPARPGVDRGKMIAAYAVGAHRDGRREVEVLYEPDIEKARAKSKQPNKGPWVEWPERMWEKTVGHHLFKRLPLGDLDAERRRRLLDEEYEPANAAAMLYGQPAIDARVVGELGPGEPVPESDTSHEGAADSATEGSPPSPDSSVAVGQQAVDGTVSAQAGAVPAPDTDEPEPAPEPEAETKAAFEIPTAVIDVAASYVVSTGQMKDRTLAQIAELDNGEEWFAWTLANPGRVPDGLHSAVDVFVRGRLPHLINEGEAS